MSTVKKEQKKKTSIWKPFLRFYTRFKIPWWLYLVSILFSLLYTELGVRVAEYTIKLNTGELYNSVIIGYATLTLLQSLASIGTNMAASYGSGRVTLRTRRLLWNKILRLPMAKIDEEEPSKLISRVTTDVAEASGLITYLGLFVSSVYGFVRMFLVFYEYSPAVTRWMLLAVPAAILVFWLVGKTQFISYKIQYSAINTMVAFFSEHLASVKHFKAQAMEEEEREAGFEAIEAMFRANVLATLISALQTTIYSIYTKFCMIVLVFSGRTEIQAGRLESTGLTAANTYLSNVQQYLAEILSQYQEVKGTQGVLEKSANLLEEKEENPKEGTSMPSNSEDLVLNHVSFTYRKGEEILHDVSLRIPAGKKTAIVGGNGSGKSTLFKLLMRFYQPSSGTIRYGQLTADEIHLDEWRRSFGYVLQETPLLDGTIRDNMTYGLNRGVSEKELENAAKAAGAWDFICEFPEKFDKEVGEAGMYLSGGQRQRIAIARTLITNPSLLIMDEATASLDCESEQLIWETTDKRPDGQTIVFAAHNMDAIRQADYIIVLADGHIEATGTHESLLAESPTYQAYARLQEKEETGSKRTVSQTGERKSTASTYKRQEVTS